jgi:hypothetical protein
MLSLTGAIDLGYLKELYLTGEPRLPFTGFVG